MPAILAVASRLGQAAPGTLMRRFRGQARRRARVALIAAALALSTAGLPANVSAAGFTVVVQPPNGVNDTAHIQAALDKCVAHGPGCTVRLRSGTYRTMQVLVNNFHGAVVGAGMDDTTLQTLPGYVVGPNIFALPPNATTNPYPFIMSFGGVSDVTMSDFEFRVTGFNPVPGTWIYHVPVTWLKGCVYVTGSGRFTRMAFIGAAGTDAWTDQGTGIPYPGVNVDNSVLVMSTIPGGGSAGPSVFSLTGSRVITDGNGFELAYFSGRATIGGSPSNGNVFRDSAGGVFFQLDGATVTECYNRIESSIAGFYEITFLNLPTPAVMPRALVAHNSIATDGVYYMDGILDIGSGLALTVTDNKIRTGGDGTGEGIGLVATGAGTVIRDNTITGAGIDAVGLYAGTTLARVSDNEVEGFTPTAFGPGNQYYLDPSTYANRIVCDESSDTVLDQGTGNHVIDCAGSAAAATTALAPLVRVANNGRHVPATRFTSP